MAWYKQGTIAITGTMVTGTDTNWTDNKMSIGAGQALLIPGGGTVKIYEIARVNSATSITLASSAETVAAGSAYAIMSFYTDSRPDFNRRLAAQLSYYQSQIDGWQDIMTGAGDITLEAPDGTTVTISSFKKLTDDMAGKLDKLQNLNDLNDKWQAKANIGLRGFNTLEDQTIVYGPQDNIALTVRSNEWGGVVVNNGQPVPLSPKYGGTGASGGDYWTACTNIGAIRQKPARFVTGDDSENIIWKNSTGFITGQIEDGLIGAWMDITSFDNSARMQLIGFYSSVSRAAGFAYKVFNPNAGIWRYAIVRDDRNTIVDTNGFIKVASPVVKIFSDGRYETNGESEGAQVERLSVGQYLVAGCTGLNSDAAWGGIDGGFDIPKDRNCQPLIWLDYEVNPDGSVLVKTYHRTHPDAPAFARNEIEGLSDGDPIDIPGDQFVSVRVEMPSILEDQFSI